MGLVFKCLKSKYTSMAKLHILTSADRCALILTLISQADKLEIFPSIFFFKKKIKIRKSKICIIFNLGNILSFISSINYN